MTRTDRLSGAMLVWLLGAWIGGSLVLGGIVAYNFAGLEALFDRNPALAAQAGFDVTDTAAKKSSLLWVHASELNRALFEYWNMAQLVLGLMAIGLAWRARSGWPVLALLALAWGLVVYLAWVINPEVVRLGRALDFVARVPPPPGLASFQRLHGTYFSLQLVQWLALLAASVLVLRRRSERS
jgi:hypothetical protein